MREPVALIAAGVFAAVIAVSVALAMHASSRAAGTSTVAAANPSLTVTAALPRQAMLPVRISANGNIMAWQEASVGTEADGLRLAEVRAAVGDVVRRGQVLAVFDAGTVAAALAQSRAGVSEAEAALAAATDDAQRARALQATGALSAQQIRQYLTAESTARARLEAAQAAARSQQLRLAQARVLAPDDGVISARNATVGAVVPAGQELFRLVRRGRLEWRAEVTASELTLLKAGQVASVTPVGGETLAGRLRVLAPTVDMQSRNGMAYVDLPAGAAARAGMFARGEFDIGAGPALTLPHGAVVQRDGFSYVMRIGPDSRVIQTRVGVGRRAGDLIEITSGLGATARVVASGAAFLGDGDLVRVVEEAEMGAAR